MLIINKETGARAEYSSIQKIIIYGHGEKLFTAESSYFEEYAGSERYGSVYDGRINAVTLSIEPKRAVKENLNRADNYLLKYIGEYAFQSGHVLYIHESEISVTDEGKKLATEFNGEKNYLHAYTLHFTHGVTMTRCKYEKIQCGGDWTIPEGKSWQWGSGFGRDYDHAQVDTYDTSDSAFARAKGYEPEKGVIIRWLEPETVYDVKTARQYYCRTEYDDARKERNELARIISKALNKDFSHYDVEKLLTVLNISIKA